MHKMSPKAFTLEFLISRVSVAQWQMLIRCVQGPAPSHPPQLCTETPLKLENYHGRVGAYLSLRGGTQSSIICPGSIAMILTAAKLEHAEEKQASERGPIMLPGPCNSPLSLQCGGGHRHDSALAVQILWKYLPGCSREGVGTKSWLEAG